jgi:hypothetical protein
MTQIAMLHDLTIDSFRAFPFWYLSSFDFSFLRCPMHFFRPHPKSR